MLTFSEYLAIVKRQLQTNEIRKSQQGAWNDILRAVYENRRFLSEKHQRIADKLAQKIKEMIK